MTEDGRTLVAASRGEFDVIVGDLYLPWGSGAGRLYSVEHFRSVRRALDHGVPTSRGGSLLRLPPLRGQS